MTRSMESKSDANLDVIRPLSVTWKKGRGAPITLDSRHGALLSATKKGGIGKRVSVNTIFFTNVSSRFVNLRLLLLLSVPLNSPVEAETSTSTYATRMQGEGCLLQQSNKPSRPGKCVVSERFLCPVECRKGTKSTPSLAVTKMICKGRYDGPVHLIPSIGELKPGQLSKAASDLKKSRRARATRLYFSSTVCTVVFCTKP